MKPIVIRQDIADGDILALAADVTNAQYETWGAFGAMLRRMLPRVLEGWDADDISAMTLGDLLSLPAQLVHAVEQRQTPINVPER
jgi:hypothetical protein